MVNFVKTQKQIFYMQKALLQAKKAFHIDEVPIGAVIVSSDGEILASAYNQVEKRKTQTAHAEILAIKKATKQVDDWRLSGCSIYVTLEPCMMCFGLIALSRIENIFFGAKSSLYGYSGYDIDSKNLPDLYTKHIKLIQSGVCEPESIEILKQFFKKKREDND